MAAADVFEGLPAPDGGLATTGVALALDRLPATGDLVPEDLALGSLALGGLAPGGLGAVGWTTVGRTGLVFWDGRDGEGVGVWAVAGAAFADAFSLVVALAVATGGLGAMGGANMGRTGLAFRDGLGSPEGDFTTMGPVPALAAVPLPVVLPGALPPFLILTLPRLGCRGPLLAARLAAPALDGLTRLGAGSLTGGDAFFWSTWASVGGAPEVGLRGAVAWGGVGPAVSDALDFKRAVGALPVDLACCLGAGGAGSGLRGPTAFSFPTCLALWAVARSFVK